MYFYGKLEVDPSQMTFIKRVKPTGLFTKLLDAFSFGQLSDKQEHETFTALSILQQLSIGLRTLNIRNVIRLAIDDYDFYMDESGVEDDLNQAMFELKAKIDPLESEVFKTIYMVLEHHDESLKYVIEIGVERKHRVGQYPINIMLNAVVSDFKLNEGESKESLQSRIDAVIGNQESYEKFVNSHKHRFDSFLHELELAIRKVIRVDDVKSRSSVNILRPNRRIQRPDEMRNEHHNQPFFMGYFGLSDFTFYSMMWADIIYDHNLYINDFNLVDELGNQVLSVGNEGFNTQDNNAFNIDSTFEAPRGTGIEYYDGSENDSDSSDSDDYDSSDSSDSGSDGGDGGD